MTYTEWEFLEPWSLVAYCPSRRLEGTTYFLLLVGAMDLDEYCIDRPSGKFWQIGTNDLHQWYFLEGHFYKMSK
jgi:hypothetical protein